MMGVNYVSFMKDLAKKYLRANHIKEFPLGITMANSAMIEFAEEADLEISLGNANLGQIAFFAEYARIDD